jgi:two-component system KDP operon response regulator KdpE
MSATGRRVLVVDDEPQIRKFLRISLGAHGFDVIEAATAAEGLGRCARESPDLVVLDLGLPDYDGLKLVAEIRQVSEAPIVVLSVRANERDKVQALDAGANDYVTKPFGINELVARIRAALRVKPTSTSQPVYRRGALMLDLARRKVTLNDAPLALSKREFELLALLVRHAGMVLTHRQLLREIWGPEHESDVQYLRVYVGQLRQKLGDDPSSPRFIANEQGVGYRFIDETGEAPAATD